MVGSSASLDAGPDAILHEHPNTYKVESCLETSWHRNHIWTGRKCIVIAVVPYLVIVILALILGCRGAASGEFRAVLVLFHLTTCWHKVWRLRNRYKWY